LKGERHLSSFGSTLAADLHALHTPKGNRISPVVYHRCNFPKGPNVSSLDAETGQIVPQVHPRRDEWRSHFRLRGAYIEGIAPRGWATARVLTLNDARRLKLRMELNALGEW
jgi:hypothetical protein